MVPAGQLGGPDNALVQAWNPFINCFADSAGQRTDGYSAWGNIASTQDGLWSKTGAIKDRRQDSALRELSPKDWSSVRRGNDTSLARASAGDMYVGYDRNLYRGGAGQWQRYLGGGKWQEAFLPRRDKDDTNPGPQAAERAVKAAATGTELEKWQISWRTNWNDSTWKSLWEAAGERKEVDWTSQWARHDLLCGLNQDYWARSHGAERTFACWRARTSSTYAAADGDGGSIKDMLRGSLYVSAWVHQRP